MEFLYINLILNGVYIQQIRDKINVEKTLGLKFKIL